MSCSDFQSTSSNCVFFLAGDTHLVIQFPLNSLESRCPVVEGILSCTCVSARVPQLAKMTERSHCVMEVLTWKEQQQHHSGTIHNTNWASVISVCLLRRALLQRWRSTCKLSRWQLTEEMMLVIQLWNGNSKDIVQRKLSLQGKLMRVLLIMWWRPCWQYQQSMQSGRVNTFIGKCAVV